MNSKGGNGKKDSADEFMKMILGDIMDSANGKVS
jgi:hypothetical protein